jgi:hypothetical protein
MDTDKDVGIRSIPTLSVRDQKPSIDEEAKWAHTGSRTGSVCRCAFLANSFFESMGAGQASRFRHSPASLQARMAYENMMKRLVQTCGSLGHPNADPLRRSVTRAPVVLE